MNSSPYILGISASHNGSACLLRGNQVVVAIQEERLTRIKRMRVLAGRSSLSVPYCLQYAGIKASDLSLIVISVQGRVTDPLQNINQNPDLAGAINKVPVLFIPHHYAHAVSAFALSGFRNSAILVVDGIGSPADDFLPAEAKLTPADVPDAWETISLYQAEGAGILPLEKHVVPHGKTLFRRPDGMFGFRSFGAMFQAASIQIFGQDMEAGKVMGLAPYGRPIDPPSDFFSIKDGCVEFFDTVPQRFSHKKRWPEEASSYQDLACSIQAALEQGLKYFAAHLREMTGSRNLCYAGGVALNSVANEIIAQSGGFSDMFIIPAAEDSGASLGAAFHGLWQLDGRKHHARLTRDEFGAPYPDSQVQEAINDTPAVVAHRSSDFIAETVEALCTGDVVAWFQGGSELGPRALGQRSILFDPRRKDGKEILNRRVKHREAFRPFAPACLREHVAEWFETAEAEPDSPFMLRVISFRREKQGQIPAVVHVDGTGRLQTLSSENHPLFYRLVREFYNRTGVPILLNTSFNVAGEPIVETPEDALFCLLATGIDVCVLGDQIVRKTSAYSSILDLYPCITAKKLLLEQEINKGLIHLEHPELFQASAIVSTPWGDYTHSFTSSFLWVLRQINGNQSGWDLLAILARSSGKDSKPMVDESSLIRILLALKRMRIIGFRVAPGLSDAADRSAQAVVTK
ncbi:MAG TPA: carbamoyltransferase C-terminal domain-containing protein [Candidatus Angelobacter sp.]|jgi:carbamoyltransferase|nr:carbamoyltransferase C-terminal domain-containing protein [Candidatus Angelobacter sp.]